MAWPAVRITADGEVVEKAVYGEMVECWDGDEPPEGEILAVLLGEAIESIRCHRKELLVANMVRYMFEDLRGDSDEDQLTNEFVDCANSIIDYWAANDEKLDAAVQAMKSK